MTDNKQPQLLPLLYKVTFLLPSWGRKTTYVVLAEGVMDAIEAATAILKREHGSGIVDSLSKYEPRWVHTESGGVDTISPRAMAYYNAASDRSSEGEGE